MNPHVLHYHWKKGRPKGVEPVRDASSHPTTYKVVHDPYFIHITLEKYHFGKFQELIYDSQLLNFRKLNPRDQHAWSRETVQIEKNSTACVIRDVNDRILYLETHYFDGNFCTSCEVKTPHGWLISTHRMYLQKRGDPFNGVILYDRNSIPVMKKVYAVSESDEFTDLLQEEWEITLTLLNELVVC